VFLLVADVGQDVHAIGDAQLGRRGPQGRLVGGVTGARQHQPCARACPFAPCQARVGIEDRIQIGLGVR
jgi:hypothetical protein